MSGTRRRFRCSGDTIPAVQLALEKQACLRTGGTKLRTPSEIAQFVRDHYGCSPQEHFLAIYFSARNEVLNVQEVAIGNLDSTQVDPRVLFAGALLASASAIVVVHNHPSGDPEPSAADIALTKRLKEGAALLGLNVLDHVIVGRGSGYVSLLERGQL